MRVNDLAKELGKANKDLISLLAKNGAGLKVPMSNISDQEADMVRKHYSQNKAEAPIVKKTETSADNTNQKAETPAVKPEAQTPPRER